LRGQLQQTQKGGTEWSKSKKKGEDYLENSNWSSPVPLRTDKSALPDFPLACLPLVPQAMAVGVAETTSTDISMSATALLSALSFCFSGVYRMFGKADHSEPLTLYSLILANPAERKSPVMRFVKSPFLSFTEDYNKRHKDEIYTSQEAYKKLEAEISEMQNKNESTAEEIAAKRTELDNMESMSFRRVCVDDVTPEALVKLLKENETLLMLSDEAGAFKNFGGRYSNGVPNVDLFLKCWGGESFMKDRCNSDTVILKKPYLSVCLCGQPYILDELMDNKAFLSSGLVARFLYCYPKSFVGRRSYATKAIDSRITEGYNNFVYYALETKFNHKGEETPLKFSGEAQKAYADYYDTAIESVLLTDFAECPDWGGKYHGLILRLCGIIHCIKCLSENVSPESREVDMKTLGQAIDIADFYKQQSRYAYSLMDGDGRTAAAEYVLKKLRANNVRQISGRDLLHLCRKFRTMDELSQPVAILTEHGYLRKIRIENENGKTVSVFEVNEKG